MKFLILVLLSGVLPLSAYAQGRDNIWMLGYDYGGQPKPAINFINGTPDTFSLVRQMEFFITNASICDTSGQVLFYTNGKWIANRNHDTLFNSQNFNPGWQTVNSSLMGLNIGQGALILPYPNNPNKYILFHESGEYYYYQLPGDTTPYPSAQPFNLAYSVIDMNLDGGMGGIDSVQKDIHAINDTLFQGWLTACKHGNGRDWWVIVHKWYSDLFYKFLITPQGVSLPTAQIFGPVMLPSDGLRDFDIRGQACFSPDGSQYAMAGQSNIVHLFDFDRCSGLLSNYRETSIDTIDRVRACSFSPNSRFLYVSHLYHNFYQFDTWQSNLDSAGTIVAQWDSLIDTTGIPIYIFTHQLAPDGKIYINTFNSTKYFHVIDEPDSLGSACNLLQHAFTISNFNVTIPNFPNYYLGAEAGSICDSLTGINENIGIDNLNLRINPNPAQNVFYINYKLPNSVNADMHIYDMIGNEVMRKKLYWYFSYLQIDGSFLNDGVYFIIITTENKHTAIGKVVIAK